MNSLGFLTYYITKSNQKMKSKEFKYVMRNKVIDNFKVTIIENVEVPSFTISLDSHYLPTTDSPVYELINQNVRIDKFVKEYNKIFDNPVKTIFAFTEIPEKGFNQNKSSFIHNEVILYFDERKLLREEMRVIVTNIMYDVLEWLNENNNFTYHTKKI